MRSVAAACLTAIVCGALAAAAHAAPVPVEVRIEGRSRTLFEGPILTDGHDVRSYKADGGSASEDLEEHRCDGIDPIDAGNTAPGPTPTAAGVDAFALIGETDAFAGQWYAGLDDYFVKQWGSQPEDAEVEGRSWGLLVNNVFTDVGGCQYELREGAEVLWAFDAFASRPFLALLPVADGYSSGERPLTATARLDVPFEVEAIAYEDLGEGSPPPVPGRAGAEPYANAVIAPVATSERGVETPELDSPASVATDAEGGASITFTTPGWHRIMAGSAEVEGEEAAVRSNRLDVCVPAAGESGCGSPPLEDDVRVLPQYERELEAERGTPEGSGGEAGDGGAATNGEPPVVGDSPVQAPNTGAQSTGRAPSPAGAVARARILAASVTATRLRLRLSAATLVTVKIERSAGRARRARLVKTLSARARGAGALVIRLPRLAPGRYRLTIAVAHGASVARSLTVAGRTR